MKDISCALITIKEKNMKILRELKIKDLEEIIMKENQLFKNQNRIDKISIEIY